MHLRILGRILEVHQKLFLPNNHNSQLLRIYTCIYYSAHIENPIPEVFKSWLFGSNQTEQSWATQTQPLVWPNSLFQVFHFMTVRRLSTIHLRYFDSLVSQPLPTLDFLFLDGHACTLVAKVTNKDQMQWMWPWRETLLTWERLISQRNTELIQAFELLSWCHSCSWILCSFVFATWQQNCSFGQLKLVLAWHLTSPKSCFLVNMTSTPPQLCTASCVIHGILQLAFDFCTHAFSKQCLWLLTTMLLLLPPPRKKPNHHHCQGP